MRIALAALALALAACSPPAPKEAEAPVAAEPAPTAPAAPAVPDPNGDSENPAYTWDDVDQDPQLIGHWSYNEATGGAFINAGFGGDATEASFTWVCDRDRRIMSLTRLVEVAPDLATSIGFIIPGARHIFAARSFNEGIGFVSAELPAADPRLDAIAASDEGFAVQVLGDTTRIRHDPMLARVLAACRA